MDISKVCCWIFNNFHDAKKLRPDFINKYKKNLFRISGSNRLAGVTLLGEEQSNTVELPHPERGTPINHIKNKSFL